MNFDKKRKKLFILDLMQVTEVFLWELKQNNKTLGDWSLIERFVPSYIKDKMTQKIKFGYIKNPVWIQICSFLQQFDYETNSFVYSELTESFVTFLVEEYWEECEMIPLLSVFQIDYVISQRSLFESLTDTIDINSSHELRLFNKDGVCILMLPYFDPKKIGSK